MRKFSIHKFYSFLPILLICFLFPVNTAACQPETDPFGEVEIATEAGTETAAYPDNNEEGPSTKK